MKIEIRQQKMLFDEECRRKLFLKNNILFPFSKYVIINVQNLICHSRIKSKRRVFFLIGC